MENKPKSYPNKPNSTGAQYGLSLEDEKKRHNKNRLKLA
jgi:hypothetical protein